MSLNLRLALTIWVTAQACTERVKKGKAHLELQLERDGTGDKTPARVLATKAKENVGLKLNGGLGDRRHGKGWGTNVPWPTLDEDVVQYGNTPGRVQIHRIRSMYPRVLRKLVNVADALIHHRDALNHLLNVLASREIPKDWKWAHSTSIFKTRKKEDLRKYRPVSLISVHSKHYGVKSLWNHF